tara:strand:+ start:580 stop:765 length:186 start_codon:yes stop_codon:yes gene_type:complete
MPKKKLTKKQTVAKMGQAIKILSDLFYDKMEYSDSSVPLSLNKMLELRNTLGTSRLRLMRK